MPKWQNAKTSFAATEKYGKSYISYYAQTDDNQINKHFR